MIEVRKGRLLFFLYDSRQLNLKDQDINNKLVMGKMFISGRTSGLMNFIFPLCSGTFILFLMNTIALFIVLGVRQQHSAHIARRQDSEAGDQSTKPNQITSHIPDFMPCNLLQFRRIRSPLYFIYAGLGIESIQDKYSNFLHLGCY